MQRAAAAAVAVVALASVGLGLARVWPELGRQHALYASWSDDRAERAPGLRERLPPAPFDAFRAAITPGSRYYFDVPAGGVEGLTNRGTVFRTFATYWLLPSVPVDSPAQADVVVAYRADVSRLGLRFARIERPAPGVTVAWPAR